ncbi:DEAD/DEAH box helicase family protein [Candidatus Pacearchaeota archaeon]|nr:DEAD/DEAH box helicase family protein [Candidatus Pacearchaeota archaeon]
MMPEEKFLKDINPREYQKKIFEKCKEKNCLVVLPTGIGKTLVALLLTIHRMQKFPEEKILFLAPTRPLAEQHIAYFKKYLPELFAQMELFTGKVDAEKRKKIWQRTDIIFSTPQCIDGGTLIFTGEGPIKISDFFKQFNFEEKNYLNGKIEVAEINEKILGYNGQKIDFLKATKAWKRTTEEVINIKTEIGNTLLCTKDHPLLTISPCGELIWKEASSLNKGDYIASSKKIDIEEKNLDILNLLSSSECLKIADTALTKDLIKKLKEKKIKTSPYSRYFYNFMPIKLFLELSKKIDFDYSLLTLTDSCGKSSPIKLPKKLDNKLAYILGAMFGDGHIGDRIGHGSEVVLSELERESISQEFKEAVKEVFGIEMKKDKTKGLIAYNSALAHFFSHLGIPKGKKARRIEIPKFLFFADKDSINGFIKGIFDTDGHASKYGVSISSVSEKFVQGLKWLFLRIGILGNIEKTKSHGTINGRHLKESEIFTFKFTGRLNLKKFLESSPNKEKCKKLIETLNNTKRPETRSKEILPIPELMKKIHKSNMSKAEYYKFSCLSLDNLKKLSSCLEGESANKLKELLNLPIRWVKIKEKRGCREKREVYDLSVDKHHNFIANYLVNHNCIANDLKKKLYDLEGVSLLIEDEAHKCVKNYSYTYVAKKYIEQAKNARILGLTASPGADKKSIKLICENLNIEEVEIRTRESEDLKEYLQELDINTIKVEFPQKFKEIKVHLKNIYDKNINSLKEKNILNGPANKIALLDCQKRIMAMISRGSKNFNLFYGASLCAQAIKIGHAIELLETQTLYGLNNYIESLNEQARQNKSRAVKKLVSNPDFTIAYEKIKQMINENLEHPKLLQLKAIIESKISSIKNPKIIVFSQYRDSVTKICKEINSIENASAKVFVGQAKKGDTGLSQKEQREIISDFSDGKFNVLVSTQIGEEGLDIPEVDTVIFYEPVPSAIRKIQRAGRTARLMPGELIMLITKDTRDEAYYWAAYHKEKRMHNAISSIKQEMQDGTFNAKAQDEEIESEGKSADENKKDEEEIQKKLI